MASVRRIPKRWRFPAGGLFRAFGYQGQPPFTTPECLNVRPFDRAGRIRGGPRPGMERRYVLGNTTAPLGEVGNRKVRFVDTMGIARNDGFSHWLDDFGTIQSSLYSIIPAGQWPDTPIGFNREWTGTGWAWRPEDGYAVAVFGTFHNQEHVVGRRHSVLPIDHAQPFSIAIGCVPMFGYHRGDYCLIFNYTDVNNFAGVYLQPWTNTDFTGERGYFDIRLFTIIGGTYVESTATGNHSDAELPHSTGGELLLLVDGTTLTAFWYGEQVHTNAFAALPSDTDVIGVGLNPSLSTNFGDDPWGNYELSHLAIDYFRSHYFDTGVANYEDTNKTILVTSAGGNIYREEEPYALSKETTLTGDVGSDRTLATQERNQLLFIADTGDPIVDSEGDGNGTVTVGAGTDFDDAGVADWTSAGPNNIDLSTASNKATYHLEIFNGQGTIVNGSYKITGATVGSLTISPGAGIGTCDYRIRRAPKIYDPSVPSLTIWDTASWIAGDPYPTGDRKGSVPSGCSIICKYRDRLVLAGNPPYVFYMSRVGDPYDFYFSADADDLSRAVGGTTDNVGVVGTFLTAVIPHVADYLIFAGMTNMMMQRGDITLGGEIDELSDEIGIIGRPGRYMKAWCKGPAGACLVSDTVFGVGVTLPLSRRPS